MKPSYEEWALNRLTKQPRCSLEPTMCCIPLRGDPICMTCFEIDMTQKPNGSDDNN